MIGYGAMVVESLLGIVALVVVGAVAVNGSAPEGTPFAIFSTGVAGFLEKFGVPVHVATVFMTMCVSARHLLLCSVCTESEECHSRNCFT